MSTAIQPTGVERYEPELPKGAAVLEAPVRGVTLLEDRAQVTRRGTVRVSAGQNRVVVHGVAPVVQDVSLRAEVLSGTARVADVRIRRGLRIRTADKPEAARALEERLEALRLQREQVLEDQLRARDRFERIHQMVILGVSEIPADAGWGMGMASQWQDSFDALFRKSRQLREGALQGTFTAEQLAEEIAAVLRQRQALDRVDHQVVSWLEADVLADAAGEVEVRIDYVVPNALWRPLHTARLVGGKQVHFTSSAAVWQNTGEDWKDVELQFSTARSSLGTEPPLLHADSLTVKKKSEQVMVQARQVQVQKAGLGSAPATGGAARPAAPAAVDLPGVDDGGETRNLKAPGKNSVPSDGRPNVIPLFTFEDGAEAALVTFPELEPKAFLRATSRNAASSPVLAGPVELLQENGFVGWTQTLFVAPKEKFELSFGPDDAVRIQREEKKSSKVHPVSKWTDATTHVTLYLSNLSGEARTVKVTERLPVSEIEHVKVELDRERTSDTPELDDNGFCTWNVELPGNGHLVLHLWFKVSLAPGVQSV
ncbi:mucoidy inhibitor MuiA family protein [Hyalangium rubrum]|uniref:Mucoidy inhibitor MuiA family protein n=1 Tax=Hyalangium rubrum TaxID=3103134 RepID=A0ABU5HJ88_9BACT|nr:mucoidy inhibitor MuiA family protein [Hyalangium sp. s54d21]MDY7233227.1 mucoidy inhibitor MuiA family protein [Hyalangium sp. s54d21]